MHSLTPMIDWSVALPAFLASSVEWVEAFTIVLAVSLQVGGRLAASAAAAGLATVGLMTLLAGGLVRRGADLGAVRLVIGIFLLLFGLRWLGKAIARAAGLRSLHDEGHEFDRTRAALSRADRGAAWLVAYKGVLIEGLEVWLVVVSLAIGPSGWTSSAGGALVGLLLVAATGLAIRAPLARVPENSIKFIVGAMITGFGSFWTLESLPGRAGQASGLRGDWALLGLELFYLGGGLLVALLLRRFRPRLRASGA